MTRDISQLTFVTGNLNKYTEAQAAIPTLKHKNLNLPEIQEIDLYKVLEFKLNAALEAGVKQPLVEDTALELKALNGLPGPLIKWFVRSIGLAGIYELCSRYMEFDCQALTAYAFYDHNGKVTFATGQVSGRIVSARGTGWGWDSIFQPEGSELTFGQLNVHEKQRYSMRAKALKVLAEMGNRSGG